jgi:hypothetical protein
MASMSTTIFGGASGSGGGGGGEDAAAAGSGGAGAGAGGGRAARSSTVGAVLVQAECSRLGRFFCSKTPHPVA